MCRWGLGHKHGFRIERVGVGEGVVLCGHGLVRVVRKVSVVWV